MYYRLSFTGLLIMSLEWTRLFERYYSCLTTDVRSIYDLREAKNNMKKETTGSTSPGTTKIKNRNRLNRRNCRNRWRWSRWGWNRWRLNLLYTVGILNIIGWIIFPTNGYIVTTLYVHLQKMCWCEYCEINFEYIFIHNCHPLDLEEEKSKIKMIRCNIRLDHGTCID